jgi:hypothetical protein
MQRPSPLHPQGLLLRVLHLFCVKYYASTVWCKIVLLQHQQQLLWQLL